jgi:hypothetical protein
MATAHENLLDAVKYLGQAAQNITSYLSDRKDSPLENAKGNLYTDFRVNDSFKIRFVDNKVIVVYQVETANPLVPHLKFKMDVERKFKDIVSSLQNEYKNVSGGKSIKLKKIEDPIENVEYISFTRALNTYIGLYELSGKESLVKNYEEEVEKYYKDTIKKYGKDQKSKSKK